MKKLWSISVAFFCTALSYLLRSIPYAYCCVITMWIVSLCQRKKSWYLVGQLGISHIQYIINLRTLLIVPRFIKGKLSQREGYRNEAIRWSPCCAFLGSICFCFLFVFPCWTLQQRCWVTFLLPLCQLERLPSSQCGRGHTADQWLLWGPHAKSSSRGQSPRGLPNTYNDLQKIMRCKQTQCCLGSISSPAAVPGAISCNWRTQHISGFFYI